MPSLCCIPTAHVLESANVISLDTTTPPICLPAADMSLNSATNAVKCPECTANLLLQGAWHGLPAAPMASALSRRVPCQAAEKVSAAWAGRDAAQQLIAAGHQAWPESSADAKTPLFGLRRHACSTAGRTGGHSCDDLPGLPLWAAPDAQGCVPSLPGVQPGM